jgi:AcrR family transcriptional regulator
MIEKATPKQKKDSVPLRARVSRGNAVFRSDIAVTEDAPIVKKEPASKLKILAVAMDLFARRGFKGTTTAEIARQAGVNEAIIFRHFPAKDDLYSAILNAKIENESTRVIIEAAECECLPVVDALKLVGERFFQACKNDPIFLRLYYFSALEGHELASSFYEKFASRLNALVAKLIERGIRDGVIREVDPDIAARCYIGSLRSHLLVMELFPSFEEKTDKEAILRGFTDIFLRGVGIESRAP